MPLGTMSAVILIIALLSGLMPETQEKLKTGKYPILAALILAPVLRMAGIELSREVELNAGCLFIAAVAGWAAARANGRRTLLAAALAAAAAIPAFAAETYLKGDAAVLAASLAALPLLPLIRSLPHSVFAAVVITIFVSLFRWLFAALSGYGVLELTGADFDAQLTGLLFSVFTLELRRWNRSSAAAESTQ